MKDGVKNMQDFPKVIELQLQNKCNSFCLICPYKDMNYHFEKMPNELFEKIIIEISKHPIQRLIPYLNNEPFLDPNYIEKIYFIRKMLPNVEIEISSNASLLTENIARKLVELNITELRLSIFGYDETTYKKMMPGLDKNVVFKNLNDISKILKVTNITTTIIMIDNDKINDEEFKKMEIFANNLGFEFEKWGYLDRCKNVKWKSNNIYKRNVIGCEQKRPVERMHILANGKVIFCCQDWSHTLIMGDINKESIYEIWNSNYYNQLRNSIYKKEENAIELCKNCKLALV